MANKNQPPTKPLIIQRTLNAPIDKVWSALTDPKQMKKWYFDLPGFKAKVGYEFSFSGGKDPDNPYLHLCKITEVIPGKRIAYSWRYDGYPGNSIVTFELTPMGEKTKIKLTHSGLETFAYLNPDFALENFKMGWTAIIGTSLKDFLKKE